MARAETVIQIMGRRVAELETDKAILQAELTEAQEQIHTLRQQLTERQPDAPPIELVEGEA